MVVLGTLIHFSSYHHSIRSTAQNIFRYAMHLLFAWAVLALWVNITALSFPNACLLIRYFVAFFGKHGMLGTDRWTICPVNKNIEACTSTHMYL
jgi:hypothetical protein